MNVINLAWITMIVNTVDVLICIAIAIILVKRQDRGEEIAGDLPEKKQINIPENQVNPLQEELTAVKTGYSAIKKENSDSKDRLARKDAELKEALSKHSLAEKESKRLSEELKALKTKNVKLSDFNAEVEKLKKEIDLQNNNVESLKKKDNDNIKQVNFLQEELKAAQDSYSVARSELQEVSKKALDFSKEINKQKGLLDANKADLENALSNYLALEKDFERLSEEFEVLKIENAELSALQARVEQEKEEKPLAITEGKENVLPVDLEIASREKYTQILEIMAEQNFISKDAFAATFAYYEKSGGNFARYLIDCCHIDELKLAQTICHQFGVPYLPLNSYDISVDIIQLVPRDIVEKYWLMPLQKNGSSLTVVMADPFDNRAINMLEKITGYKVQAFVGVLSDIIQALENYYKIVIKESGYKGQESTPLFITTEVYKGIDRRQGHRFEIKLDVFFPYQGSYKKAVTKDVSQGGFLFDSDAPLEIGSVIPLQIDLPKEINLWPILAVIQVLRVQPSQDERFDVAVKIIKISKEEIDMIIKYALEHKEHKEK